VIDVRRKKEEGRRKEERIWRLEESNRSLNAGKSNLRIPTISIRRKGNEDI